LSSWFIDLFDGTLNPSDSPTLVALHNAMCAREGRNIIELGQFHGLITHSHVDIFCSGAGSGIVSLMLAALRASLIPHRSDCIIATDLRTSSFVCCACVLTSPCSLCYPVARAQHSRKCLPLSDPSTSSCNTGLGRGSARVRT
jgi:hypothetical protein